jgi:hypothetical protein
VPRKSPNILGERFGRLVVTELLATSPRTRWRAACDCGNTWEGLGSQLTTGHTQSCGCSRADANRARQQTHGMRDTRVYAIWNAMRQRCTNPNQPHYERYGGRGITVCPEWLESFEKFYADMGDPPTDDHSIDRIENDRGYEPGNCRWATRVEQQANTRPRRPETFKGTPGETHPKAKLTEDNVREIRSSPERNCDIARRFDVSKQTIEGIRKGRTWKHVK